MTITLVNPEGLPEVGVYHQVSVASGSKLVFLAGQVSVDADATTLGEGDLAAQTERCYLNVATALAGAGATFADVAKLTVYVVDWAPEKMPLLLDGIARASAALGTAIAPPGTLLGVAALASPAHLVEVEAVAVLD
ncbi:RidA family protein [Streptomyces xanthochromogenes]|uniref:Enamine deaminase RidA n=1 Tax=Streptomyces xanthochromogenes TaxID=67384 RepID=A0ABQ3ADR9_9ACTN|nr:RidA family protein [Streptomyces xanthochromogenes]GGY42551.1 enamine deaminase RidA [Streptomyces xanthochromogenes]